MILQTCCRRLRSARASIMPLRAKILDPAKPDHLSRQFASAASPRVPISEQPGDEANDVLFESRYGLRTITLNRPKKLNSLNGSMCRKIIPRLQEWSKSDMANVVVIKGEGRAFCAGGDVAALALKNKEGRDGQQWSKDYFTLEYQLDHMIATYSKPYIAFMDGITMGGGVGLSINAPFRIATEKTVFAMPETTIGFFPDVGASFFLPRLDGSLGMHLALTSEQIKGVNALYAGIATHYLHSSSLPDLEARLAELQFKDYHTLAERLPIINSTIEEFCTGLPHDQPLSAPCGGNTRKAIDYCFQPAHDTMQKIMASLTDLSGNADAEVAAWASKTKDTILQRSPTSLRVTVRQLNESARWGIGEAFVREHAIASRFMEHADFIEGVSARLIDKPTRQPRWDPAALDDVSELDVDAFLPPRVRKPMTLLHTGEGTDYKTYPHSWIGLPRERQIALYIAQNQPKNFGSVVQYFVRGANGKQGVREKVSEYLHRCYRIDGGQVVSQDSHQQ